MKLYYYWKIISYKQYTFLMKLVGHKHTGSDCCDHWESWHSPWMEGTPGNVA